MVASIFVDSCRLPYGALEDAMEQVGALHCEIAESPDILMLCTCAADFEEAARSKKLGVLMSFEGAEPVSSLTLLHSFYAAGVRGLGLAWSRRNQAADGCDFMGGLKKGGLTQFLSLIHIWSAIFSEEKGSPGMAFIRKKVRVMINQMVIIADTTRFNMYRSIFWLLSCTSGTKQGGARFRTNACGACKNGRPAKGIPTGLRQSVRLFNHTG